MNYRKSLWLAVLMILAAGLVMAACGGATPTAAPTEAAATEAPATEAAARTGGHPALADVKVRQAIAYAIDKEAITTDLLLGLTDPAATLWENTPYADPSLKPYPYDPEKAKSLLDEAGWTDTNGDGTRDKDGLELVLTYGTNQREIRKQVQAVIQQQLADVGIGSELKNYESDIFFGSFGEGGPMAKGELDMFEFSNTTAFPDPDSVDFSCTEIPSDEQPQGANYSAFCDQELDDLVNLQRRQADPAARIETFHQISKLTYDKMYWLGLWDDPDLYAVGPRLQNVKLSGVTPFFNVKEWDLKDVTGKKSATFNFTQEFDTLNPAYTAMYFSGITTQIWGCAAWDFDENNAAQPRLVKEMPTVSEDGKTVTLTLRDDITWSDGEPITADDFIFTYQMAIDPQNTVSSQTPYDQVDTVEAPDPQTVVVTFKDVYAPWLGRLYTYLLPKHVLQPAYDAEGNINNAEWNKAPTVGCGPFVFQSWETGQSATFVANESYFDGRPTLDEIIVTFITDNDAQRAAVLAGDSDFGTFLDPSEVPDYEAGGSTIVKAYSGYNEGIFFRQDGK